MYVIKTSEMKVPLKIFSGVNTIEEQCIEQMKNVSSLPFIFHHTALMPDGHLGYGASIGAVVALRDVICPSIVGSDVGCGVCAIKLGRLNTILTKDKLINIISKIRQVVPVGFKKHKEDQDINLMPGFIDYGHYDNWLRDKPICYREFDNASKSLGTLGGGNHFIEIQKDDDDHIWIMIHSGSRNLGKKVADHYNKIAIGLNEKWSSSVPKEWKLAFLPINTDEAQEYLREMNYCVKFALANRTLMMNRVLKIFDSELIGGIKNNDMINTAHNYASLENHYRQNVWVHRKGATLAKEGTLGIIPGSQGTKSYIVRGKGNRESFDSSSHGAGRVMGRKQAQRELDLDEQVKKLDDRGIIHSIRNIKDLDEAPGAYKDISVVMENQKDLVDIVTELTPLAVIKG